jgi:hypothetical protein
LPDREFDTVLEQVLGFLGWNEAFGLGPDIDEDALPVYPNNPPGNRIPSPQNRAAERLLTQPVGKGVVTLADTSASIWEI